MTNREIVKKFASHPSDISEHLLRIYDTVITKSPKIIIELGVRTGRSTFVLSRAAQDVGATLTSVDIKDCSKYCNWDKWKFVKMSDLDFADMLKDIIDILFIDTSHAFKHTINELKKYLPKMNKEGIIIIHDTNIQNPRDKRTIEALVKDKVNIGGAIDIIFNITGKWNTNFTIDTENARIVNYANNNGMTYIFLK